MTETNYIWSREKLRNLLNHQLEEIQSWAACRLLELYPDMRDEMLVYLPQAPPTIAFHLLDAFRDLALPSNAVEPLQKFLEAEHRPADKAIAAMLLARCGQGLPYEDLSRLPLGDLAEDLALTEPGFGFFLWQLSQRDTEHLPDAVFYGLAYSCGAEDVYDLLREADSDSDRNRVLKKQLKISGAVKDTGTALKLLEYSLWHRAAVPSTRPQFPVLITELEQVSERCVRLVDCLRQCSKPNQETNFREIDLLVACAWSQLRDAAHWSVLGKESLDISDLWDVLTGRPWTGREVDEQTIKLLSARPAKETLSALRKALDRGGHVYHVYGEYAFRCLQAGKVFGRYDVLLDAQEGCWGDDVSRDAETILRQTGTQVLEVALDRWKERPPSAWSISWLEVNPTPAVVKGCVRVLGEEDIRLVNGAPVLGAE